uniref:L1 transposable element RRM domain-containing protein n=1 Tax=Amphiprion percula TaxID=161767 RepID=A0A3P8STI7_AMPPE
MPTQKKITSVVAKQSKTGEIGSSPHTTTTEAEGVSVMAAATPPSILSAEPLDVDNLVARITAEVLKVVETSFDKKVDPVLQKLQACSSDIVVLDTRLTTAEERISSLEDTITIQDVQLADMKVKMDSALEKIDDMENRNRRCNIRIVGLPEHSEGTDPVSFTKSWLPQLVGVDFKGGIVKVDRCHRISPRYRSLPGQRPRVFIVKLHNFQDKARIMQEARKKQTLNYKGAKIMIFEDFSAAVSRKRQAFLPVKNRLREKGIPFALLYPAVLRIKHNGEEKIFKHPE